MRICLWHGWLLEGTGSNVYAAQTAQVLRREGHDVMLLCQEQYPERFGSVDAWGSVGAAVSDLVHKNGSSADGKLTVLRPQIGSLLPVFVYDEYEGFDVKRFVDLSDEELAEYLERNVTALRSAIGWHHSDIVITGHAIPGAAIGRRAVGEGRYVAKVHGSDIEYAVKLQERYADLAKEGLEGALAVAGSSQDVLDRIADIVPGIRNRMRVIHPGVEVDKFKIRPRDGSLRHVATLLGVDLEAERGRPDALTKDVAQALGERSVPALHDLALRYDQGAPDPGAARVVENLAGQTSPLIGYLGKLIPQKGVERLIEAAALLPGTRCVIVGFGTFREWLTALVIALDSADEAAYDWLRENSDMALELSGEEVAAAAGLASRISFTGRLDHRYAPGVLAGIDALVVPSTLAEAFGMVAAEGAAAGALPIVARHSGLAEVAGALEAAAGWPGSFSFEPGAGATRRLVAAVEAILGLDAARREEMRIGASTYVSHEWSWEATVRRLLEAATPQGGGG